MTHGEAMKAQAQLSREHPEATWLLRQESDGNWSVVRANIPSNRPPELTAETEAAERPPFPEESRPVIWPPRPPTS
jgi:hypothetical protein